MSKTGENSSKRGYGQYCPIAVAAEIMAERWTPLVLRGLFCGAERFNEIQDSVPRMSPALLSRRLKELEHANIVERRPDAKGRGARYYLTPAGRELFPVLDSMGNWAQKWLRREIVQDANLDPDVLMWELRQNFVTRGDPIDGRRVACFQLDGVPASRRFYWLVFEGEEVDICAQDPGHPVDIWISASMKTLIQVWLGHDSLTRALADGRLRLDGSRQEIAAFRTWFALSHFAKEGQRLAGAIR
jgi:DNA-binding HxlR family transcriptional regulator